MCSVILQCSVAELILEELLQFNKSSHTEELNVLVGKTGRNVNRSPWTLNLKAKNVFPD